MAVINPNKAAELVKSSISKDTVNLSKTVPNMEEACPIIKSAKFRFNAFGFIFCPLNFFFIVK